MARQLARLAQAPIVASSTQNHEGSTYVHWVLESSPTDQGKAESYERNLVIAPGKYLVRVEATGPELVLDRFIAYPGDRTSITRNIPAGVTAWTTMLDIPGPTPALRLIATGYTHLLLVLHRI